MIVRSAACSRPIDSSIASCRRAGRTPVRLGHQRDRGRRELVERQFGRAGSSADQENARWHVDIVQDRPQPPPETIACHRIPLGATDRERHPGRRHHLIVDEPTPQRIGPNLDSSSSQTSERLTVADTVDQADRRARPLARRDLRTARPPRVLMRARKPCFRALRRLFG